MEIKDKQRIYKDNFELLDDPMSQSEYLIQLGMKKTILEEIHRDEDRIEGCKTAIWITAEEKAGKIHFKVDSDSFLVKGMLYIFEDLYQECEIEKIRKNPPDFTEAVSDEVIYPEIKHNGLLKCYEKIANL